MKKSILPIAAAILALTASVVVFAANSKDNSIQPSQPPLSLDDAQSNRKLSDDDIMKGMSEEDQRDFKILSAELENDSPSVAEGAPTTAKAK